MSKSADGVTPNPKPRKKHEGNRSTRKSSSEGSLIAMYRGPGISLDLRVDRPDSRFTEMIAMIKSAFPGLTARTYRDHAQAQNQSRGQDMSSSGFADFVIEEMGKLFASEEDLERMKAAIQKELSRRETTS